MREIRDEFGESKSAPDCIYCGGKIGYTCHNPQACQEAAWKRDNESLDEPLSTVEKLRRMQIGNVMRFTRDNMRILKTLDRNNDIRTKPVPALVGDGIEWEAWFEFQVVHAEDLQQVTCRKPL